MSHHNTPGTSLEEVLKEIGPECPANDGGAVADAVRTIARAAVRIARAVGRQDIEGGAEKVGTENVQGEEQKSLDVISNDIICEEAKKSRGVRAVVSEEMEKPAVFETRPGCIPLSLRVDPLDGSSNLGVNVSVGTIFAIIPVPAGKDPSTDEALLRPGTEMAAGGYVTYGPATVLVFAASGPVRSFVLDADRKEFVLTSPDVKMPAHKATYSMNEAYYKKFTPEVQRLADGWRSGSQPGGPWGARYIGSLVADFHRIVKVGGVFLYPGEAKKPEGKLRLLYEAQPLAWVAERAGGRASNGSKRILDIQPEKLHQRTPLLIGSAETVAEAEKTLKG